MPVDSWAKSHECCAVFDPENIKYISGALLQRRHGRPAVGVSGRRPAPGAYQHENSTRKAVLSIGFDTEVQPFLHTLHLVPRVISISRHRLPEGRIGEARSSRPCARRSTGQVCRLRR
ncbi:MAG: hypothetical protein ACLR4Z_03310 [Butyricicoccaceae bacterium]